MGVGILNLNDFFGTNERTFYCSEKNETTNLG